MLCAGRAFGKTRTGAEWVREQVESGTCRRLALVARTAGDVRDVIVEGESGILAISPPWFRPRWEPSKRRLSWPNGAVATTYSADEPRLLRGPQHDGAWADELAAWQYEDAWAQLLLGLRKGKNPRVVVTTTPTSAKLVRDLLRDPTTHVTRGTSYENRANLAEQWFAGIIRQYEGTRLGRQELLAEILDDNPSALWKITQIDDARLRPVGKQTCEDMARKVAEECDRVIVAIDPAVTSNPNSDETGIIVVGAVGRERGYVLEDASGRYRPAEWAAKAVAVCARWKANLVVAEVNNGGDMVESTLRTAPGGKNIPFESVRASRGKRVRAEPVSALYEQGRVHHVGTFARLEDQMCNWDPVTGAIASDISGADREDAPSKSPDRMDALVWGLTFLLAGDSAQIPQGGSGSIFDAWG